ncbi:unnamed protein product [Ceratitis capitata]|uniref:(Mediterranean fruit fly) hypothetical protein n=1 Tax=Ceratitis capitata TaxID=7213 RepID=A0A811UTG3_CERCA|nr:unnamed protein product [Ceratitis capitata]
MKTIVSQWRENSLPTSEPCVRPQVKWKARHICRQKKKEAKVRECEQLKKLAVVVIVTAKIFPIILFRECCGSDSSWPDKDPTVSGTIEFWSPLATGMPYRGTIFESVTNRGRSW